MADNFEGGIVSQEETNKELVRRYFNEQQYELGLAT